MSNRRRLPQEVRDHIVDRFHDDPETLKRCCLVSKSWVPRTQKHLFSTVNFKSAYYPKWQKVFPDPKDSPARHTRTLTVDSALGSAEEIRWIQSFSRVERLIVECTWAGYYDTVSLVPFCKLVGSRVRWFNASFVSTLVTCPSLQTSYGLFRLTHQRRQDLTSQLRTRRVPDGSPWRSEQSHPTTRTSNGSRLAYRTYFLTQTAGFPPSRHGWNWMRFLSKSGNCTRSVRRSNTGHPR